MPNGRDGASESVAATPGAGCTARTTIEECRCGEFCITSIWSTPKNSGNHARALRRVVDHCSRQRATDGSVEE